MRAQILSLVTVVGLIFIGIIAITYYQSNPNLLSGDSKSINDSASKKNATQVDSVKFLKERLDSLEKKIMKEQASPNDGKQKENTSSQSKIYPSKKILNKADFCDNNSSYKNGSTITVRKVWFTYLYNYNRGLRDGLYVFKYFDFGCSSQIGISFKEMGTEKLPDIKSGYLDLTFYFNNNTGDWVAVSAKRTQL